MYVIEENFTNELKKYFKYFNMSGLIQVDLDIGIPILGTCIMGAQIIKGWYNTRLLQGFTLQWIGNHEFHESLMLEFFFL